MPLPGGSSDKAGNRYELIWTVRSMIRVMRGEAEWIHLEPAGSEGDGIEFSLKTSSGIEYHQVKRQLTGRGVWPLRELQARGVLDQFYQRLEDPSANCVFTSTHAAHPLDELAVRARQSCSFEEFERSFLDSFTWSTNFDQLHARWDSSSREETYDRMRRIRVRTISEGDLRELVESSLGTLIAGNPSIARNALTDFAFEQVHQRLTSTDIWDLLGSLGLSRQTWAQDQSVDEVMSELNQTYQVSLRPLGIGGKTVRRQEVDRILQIFDDDQAGNTVLVSGKAGVGKTSTISQILSRIEDRDWSMLALRVDRLEVSTTPTQLGESVGLPASPVSVLAAVAEGRDCLLIIDQMDAVSLASGRNPEFFDCIGAVLHQAQQFPNMKVLTACRKFAIENDHRLRDLIGDGGIAIEVPVEEFDKGTVRNLVDDMGLAAASLSQTQLKLLSLPIHLRLLAETVSGNPHESLGFQTAADLYDRFWDYKRATLRSRVSAVQVQHVVNQMADNMSRRQALFVSVASLDDYDETVAQMVSENILVRDGPRVAFFHEGFFDYIFARGFVAADRDLVTYILEREQSLFIRSQVRQVLLHQRDISKQDFARQLEAILSDPDVRMHLKTISLSLLRSIDDPTEDEWNVVEPLLDSDLSSHLMAAMYGSAPWFDLLDRIGIIQRWLKSSDEQSVERSRVLWLLHPLQRARPTRMAELLSPFVGVSESWDERLAGIFVNSDCGAAEEFCTFALALIEGGALDQLLNLANQVEYVWRPLENLVESRPVWACRLIEAYLQRSYVLAKQSGSSNPFPTRYSSSTIGKDVFGNAARAAPREFVQLLLPFLTATLEANADKSYGPPWGDPIWGHGVLSGIVGLDDSFLAGMQEALSWLALNEPDDFREYAAKLRESEYLTHQYLLVRSYAADGQSYADEAVDYVLEDLGLRLEIDGVSISSESPIRQLLQEVTPYCSASKLAQLERLILGHYPEWERSKEGRRIRGASQMGLLASIDGSRISDGAAHRLQEHRRKFGDAPRSEPVGLQGGYVGPPIPDSEASKMSDDDWLRAIERYSSNSPSPENFLVGGAIQQSRVLEEQTKQDPHRFAKLILRIPDDANPYYFDAILRGIADADIDVETVVDACLRCHRIPARPSGRWITQPLARAKDFPLPDEALELVAWYATEDPEPDPKQVSSIRTYSQGGREYDTYEPLSVGINSARGIAAGSVARLIFQDERYLAFFLPHLEKMLSDTSDSVLACVAEALVGVLRYDRDLAVRLFLRLCSSVYRTNPTHPALDERLLSTRHVGTFLKYATQTHFNELEPILSRMIESNVAEVAEAGARWACYASLTIEEALPLAKRCTSGSAAMRLGAADVYYANIAMSAFKSECEDMLSDLFSDPDAEVRRRAARCFYRLEGPALQDYELLMENFIRSPAFEPSYSPLLNALEESTADIPDIVLMACGRVFDLAAEETGDISTATAGSSRTVASLIARVYSRATDPVIRARCLDIIDRMALHRAYGLDAITDEFDRQQ